MQMTGFKTIADFTSSKLFVSHATKQEQLQVIWYCKRNSSKIKAN